ncbi:MAG: pantoate--beta-alanine ligase [Nitriliruptor sp.]|nr:MAG: pantoate--beta-alanine ligase [Nitriliruptor sp.]
MERVTTIAELRARVARLRAAGATIGFVPTMGALHEGHLALVRLAAEQADEVVVSIFVNPAQFERADDLSAYPRDLAGDERALAGLGAAAPVLVFAPEADELYPRPPATSVRVAGLGDHLCGASRPGHFDGVGLVVVKLLNIVAPDLAVFGRKDRQQLQIVRRIVADLDLPVELLAAPTVRESDGVALSSRNRRLSAEERSSARALPQALGAAVLAARRARTAGEELPAATLREAALEVLDVPGVEVDYLEVVDPDGLQPVTGPLAPDGVVVVAVAAHVGPVRLIDNVEVGDVPDEERLLDAAG